MSNLQRTSAYATPSLLSPKSSNEISRTIDAQSEEGAFLDADDQFQSAHMTPRKVPMPLSGVSTASNVMQKQQSTATASPTRTSKSHAAEANKPQKHDVPLSALGNVADIGSKRTPSSARRHSNASGSASFSDDVHRTSAASGHGHLRSPTPAYSSAPQIHSSIHIPLAAEVHPLNALLPPRPDSSLMTPRSGSGSHSRSGSPAHGASSKVASASSVLGNSAGTGAGGHSSSLSPSLATHYLPEKVGRIHRQGSRRHRGSSPYLDQRYRSTSDTVATGPSGLFSPGGAEDAAAGVQLDGAAQAPTRRSWFGGSMSNGGGSPKIASSAGAFRRKSIHTITFASAQQQQQPSHSNSPARGSHLELPLMANANGDSALLAPCAMRDMGSPSRLSHPNLNSNGMLMQLKFGAGRAAWGPDGGGNPELGAGDFEDDDGVELATHSAAGPAYDRSGSSGGGDADAMTGSNMSIGRVSRAIGAAANAGLGLGSGGGAEAEIMGSQGMRRRKDRLLDYEERFAGSPASSNSSEHGNSEGRIHPANGDSNGYEDGHYTSRAVIGIGMFGRLFAGLFLKKATKADSTVPKGRERLRWNKFKWALFTTNIVLTVYAIGGLAGVLLTWANVWESSDVIRTANSTELVLASIAATLLLITAIIGWCGILLNNRAFLSFYNLFLWISFAFLLAPGYVTYKKRTFNLEGKVNYMWSRDFDTDDRREIQNSLSCCGYYNPFIEAAESSRCYARSTLPGCKGRFIRFQKNALKRFYLCAFGLVIPHLLFIVTALLSSNHITYRFGKGLTPNAYRLDEATARSIKNDFLAQLSSMYGPDILTDLLANQRRRISQLASLEHTNSSTYLLSDNALSPHSFDQVPLAPPNKGALFKGRHDSFSSTGISEKGSPLQQSLGLHDLMHHGASDARTSVERGDTTR